MTTTTITVQAANDNALMALMLDAGVYTLVEGAPALSAGILYSHIGGATLEGGAVPLAGRYALLSWDDEIVGEAKSASMLLSLGPHTYTGPDIRVLLGGSNYDPNTRVPPAVTMRQARLALLSVGKLAMVTAAINSLPEPTKSAAQITWEYSTEVQRHNGLVSQLGPALGMTDEQIDALFIAAKGL